MFILGFLFTAFEDISLNEEIPLKEKKEVCGIAYSYSIKESNFNQYKVSFILKEDKGRKYLVNWYTKEKIEDNITGRRIEAFGTFEKPKTMRNPHTFDYRLYLKSKEIRHILLCENLRVKRTGFDNLYYWFLNKCVSFRDEFINILEEKQPLHIAGIQKGIMFGIKSDLEESTYEEFQKNGTAHLLATSGLHMGIIYGALSKIIHPGLRLLPNIFITFIMFCYVVMADFNPSIIRAFIMIIFAVIGRIACRKYDLLAASSVAGFLMILKNPFLLFSAGFQMSFLAVFIMAFTLNKIKYFNIKDGFFKKLLPVFIIQILMAPYILYNFNYFSFSSFIANPPVTFLGTWVLMLGSIFMSFSVFKIPVLSLFMGFFTWVTELMVKVNAATYNHGALSFKVKSPGLFFIMVFYGLVFLLLNEEVIILYLRKNYKRIWSLILIVVVFSGCFAGAYRSGFESCNMMFIDIGQGNAMLFKSSDGKTLLIDGGGKKDYQVGKKILMPALLKNGINKIDYAYITHWDTDHYKGIEEISNLGMVENIITYEGNIINRNKLVKQMGIEPSKMYFLSEKDAFKVGKNITVTVLGPRKKSIAEYKDELINEKENNRSLVSKVIINDTKFLITGDIDENCERELVKRVGRYLKADILQVPHHGSKSSSSDELIKAVAPRLAVFQCGKNNYGHPAGEIIEKYKKKGIIIYRNDLQGAIGLKIGRNNKINIKSMIDAPIEKGI